ncbi:MAG: hypothetical protein HKN10_01880 [Myxococcales bacterium]|nr:hypothetical protein [Deltaproteobacteria bacterium]NNE17203.1 hypothetical protein [Myxococcales bacterium]
MEDEFHLGQWTVDREGLLDAANHLAVSVSSSEKEGARPREKAAVENPHFEVPLLGLLDFEWRPKLLFEFRTDCVVLDRLHNAFFDKDAYFDIAHWHRFVVAASEHA